MYPLAKIIEQNEAAELLIICIWFIWFILHSFMMMNMVIRFNGYMVIVVYSNQFEWFIPKTFIPI